MRGSSRDIEAHAWAWSRWGINWYGILWVAVAQVIALGTPVAVLTVIAAAI